jgi:hypothetical protein
MERVAISAHDLVGLRHFLLKSWIIGRELIAVLRSFDQEQSVCRTRGDKRRWRDPRRRRQKMASFMYNAGDRQIGKEVGVNDGLVWIVTRTVFEVRTLMNVLVRRHVER